MATWAAVMNLGGPASGQAPSGFDCSRLDGNPAYVFTGFGEAAAPDPAPVRVGRSATMVNDARPLLFTRYQIADDALELQPGTQAATLFREVHVDGERRFCTEQTRVDLFGPEDANRPFLMRCLIDGDGDGAFERMLPAGKLVTVNSRRNRPVGAPPADPSPVDLTTPVRLVVDASSKPAGALRPVVVTFVQPKRVRSDEVRVEVTRQVSPYFMERPLGFFARGAQTLNIPLVQGERVIAGYRLAFAKDARGRWTSRVLSAPSNEAELVCAGRGIALGDEVSVAYPGGMATLARDRN